MALARLCVKVGKKHASSHSDYICREGRYSTYKKDETLTAKESGNMPSWAQENPSEFWKASDENERANGSVYREFELALPRELTHEKQLLLVRNWCKQELKDHPYSFAIHEGKALDGGTQPHAHLMFSERKQDGIERNAEQFFKRYNKKSPERGGAQKGFGEKNGQGHYHERKEQLLALRGRWEKSVNQALEQAGRSERIDMRSYKERGLENLLTPEKKRLPSEWRNPEDKTELLRLRALKQEIKQTSAEIIDLERERQKVKEKQSAFFERIAKAQEKRREEKRLQESQRQNSLTPKQAFEEYCDIQKRLSQLEKNKKEISTVELDLFGQKYQVTLEERLLSSRQESLKESSAKVTSKLKEWQKAKKALEDWQKAHPNKTKIKRFFKVPLFNEEEIEALANEWKDLKSDEKFHEERFGEKQKEIEEAQAKTQKLEKRLEELHQEREKIGDPITLRQKEAILSPKAKPYQEKEQEWANRPRSWTKEHEALEKKIHFEGEKSMSGQERHDLKVQREVHAMREARKVKAQSQSRSRDRGWEMER